jgi:hypothetical protein
MSTRTCPDWPQLMEVAPELQFKHYTVDELRLPSEIVAQIPNVPLQTLTICCDAERHVFNPLHTEPDVAAALRGSRWLDLDEWAQQGPGPVAG